MVTERATAQVNGLGTGIFSDSYRSHNHCTSTASVEVVQAAPLSLQLEQPDTICIGQSAELSVQVSGGTELWPQLDYGRYHRSNRSISNGDEYIYRYGHRCISMSGCTG
ncbi:MAG: hypothetical protein U0073_14950 [Bacteroidia bacterium]